MSLQKRFKSRYPKANFADFKTEDFFGETNIFFHNKAGDEETAVFDDDKKISDLVFTSQKRWRGNLVSLQVSLLNWLTIQTPS